MSAPSKPPASLSDLLHKLSIRSTVTASSSAPTPAVSALDWSDESAVSALRTRASAALSRRVQDEEEKQKRREDDDDDSEDANDARRDDWTSGIAYVDPIGLPSRRKLRVGTVRSPTAAQSEDEDERRWTELERREERERQQAHSEEKKEPQQRVAVLHPPAAPKATAIPGRSAPTPSGPARPAKVDFQWLLQQCEALVSDSDAGLSSFDVASSALHLLQSAASDERLQSELLDLLGMEAMDAISLLLSQRAAIKLISKAELSAPEPFSVHRFLPTSSSPLAPPPSASSARAPPQLLGVSVVSQRERDLEKQRRKEDRRMARHSAKDTSSDAAARQRAIDAQRLEEQATSLNDWRSSSIQATANALPAGSRRTEHKGYDEVYIPPMAASPFDPADLVPITALDAWARPTFPGTTHLNRIQSKCFNAAYKHNNNILVCAPTGAGQSHHSAHAHPRAPHRSSR